MTMERGVQAFMWWEDASLAEAVLQFDGEEWDHDPSYKMNVKRAQKEFDTMR